MSPLAETHTEVCAVPPLVSSKNPVLGYCSDPTRGKPCLPPCHEKTVVYYCEPKINHCCDHHHHYHDDCCDHNRHYSDHDCYDRHRYHRDRDCCDGDRFYYRDRYHDRYYDRYDRYHGDRYYGGRYHDRCPECRDRYYRDRDCCDHHKFCRHDSSCSAPGKTVKTKYVVPCYRYEDGRIIEQERYVPIRHGTLPKSAFQRNGIQDQVHGYRGAQRFLCACETEDGCFVHTVVEPLRRLYPKIVQEVWPVKRKIKK